MVEEIIFFYPTLPFSFFYLCWHSSSPFDSLLTSIPLSFCYFFPHLSVFAPLYVYPVAAGLPPPCRNQLLFSANVIKRIYCYYSFLPVKSKLNEY